MKHRPTQTLRITKVFRDVCALCKEEQPLPFHDVDLGWDVCAECAEITSGAEHRLRLARMIPPTTLDPRQLGAAA